MDSEEVQDFIASASSVNFCVSERDINVEVPRTSSRVEEISAGALIPNELGTLIKMEPTATAAKNKQMIECIIEQFCELKRENDKLNKDLIGEKHRTQKYQKKLKYIQDNHVIFERLKQAYVNMKFTEASVRKCVDVTEQSVQCEGERNLVKPAVTIPDTIDFDQYNMIITNRNESDQEIYVEPDFMAIRKSAFEALRDTVAEFKKMIISQPLKSFVLNEQREAKYRRDIAAMYQENQNLKQLAINKQIELDDLKKNLEPRNSVFRKIIAKMAYKLNPSNAEYSPLYELNDKEMKVIEQIYKKFDSKLKQNKILEFTTSAEDNSNDITISQTPTPYFTPRSPIYDTEHIYYTPRTFENDLL